PLVTLAVSADGGGAKAEPPPDCAKQRDDLVRRGLRAWTNGDLDAPEAVLDPGRPAPDRTGRVGLHRPRGGVATAATARSRRTAHPTRSNRLTCTPWSSHPTTRDDPLAAGPTG
ncbi:MAG TPA: hypothetical protein VHJ79_13915, partial [Mycobacterium sp.]|nr:hypothetical protein [Mycobacterium sp.]